MRTGRGTNPWQAQGYIPEKIAQNFGRWTMHIEELTSKASFDFLSANRLGRLACVNQSQPYITPIHCVYHDSWIYGFSTVGRKVEWLRANPLACLEVDAVESPQRWTSVIVLGQYEELPDTREGFAAREFAFKLLQERLPNWWEPGYARTIIDGAERPLVPIYYRISVSEISGHRAVHDGTQSLSSFGSVQSEI